MPALDDERLFDIAVHVSDQLIVVEIEPSPSEPEADTVALVRSLLTDLRAAPSEASFFERAARSVRTVTGYDRVLVYKFAEDGSGEVIAEAKSQRSFSYLGLHFPASDIPKQARALYVKNIFRIIADINDPGSLLAPQTRPEGQPLDLSLSTLRSVSPVHLEYLRNMGVGASLSISIVVDGKLWGLFACHHEEPKHVCLERRTMAELFAELFALEITNREREWLIGVQANARRLHDQIMSTMSADRSPFLNLLDNLATFQELIQADGCGVWAGSQYEAIGHALSADEARSLVTFLNRTGASRVYSTNELSRHLSEAEGYAARVAGILAVPVSRRPRDYLIFFRREVTQFGTWGGNPEKPVELGPNGARLLPRGSFEAWRTAVTGTSLPWSPTDLASAEQLRTTLLEVILRSIDETQEAQRKAQETQTLLIGELNHRVRNTLTLTLSIVQRTGEGARTVEDFTALLGGRVRALARAHDQLTREDWSPAPLAKLVDHECDAFVEHRNGRVTVVGEDVDVGPEAFTCLALVLHELFTNCVKHGALSTNVGAVDISWRFDDTGSLTLLWTESGGPPVRPPSRQGFGRSVIEKAIPFELGGEAKLEFALTGVKASFVIPARFIHTGASSVSDAESTPAPVVTDRSAEFVSKHVLLVEDNVLIAMSTEDMLRNSGFGDVSIASHVRSAETIIDRGGIDCAVLDINLGNQASEPIADALSRRGIPFLFASGYGDPRILPAKFGNVPILSKPYEEASLVDAIDGLLAGGAPPSSDGSPT